MPVIGALLALLTCDSLLELILTQIFVKLGLNGLKAATPLNTNFHSAA